MLIFRVVILRLSVLSTFCVFQDTPFSTILKERVGVLIYFAVFVLSFSGLHVLYEHAYCFSWWLLLGDYVWSILSNHLFISQMCT